MLTQFYPDSHITCKPHMYALHTYFLFLKGEFQRLEEWVRQDPMGMTAGVMGCTDHIQYCLAFKREWTEVMPLQYSETKSSACYLRGLPTIYLIYANSVIRVNWSRTYSVLDKVNNHARWINQDVETWILAMLYMERVGGCSVFVLTYFDFIFKF